MSRKKKKLQMREFSKVVIVAFAVVWLMAALYGGWYAVAYETGFSDLLLFIGAPMTAGLVGYFCKAGFENVKKIKNSINERNE